MIIVANIDPMPAVRMTQKTMFYGRAKVYVEYKNTLAQELKLHMLGDVKGGKMVVTEKWDKAHLPTRRLVKLEAIFNRATHRHSDIDNLLKSVMDILQTAGVVYNDDQVREVHAYLTKGGVGQFQIELTYLEHE